MKKGVILLSGGLDSAVTLAWAVAQGYDMDAVFFEYGQPAEVHERNHARTLSATLGASAFTALTLFREVLGLPANGTFEFPMRNLMLISAAAAYAISRKRFEVFIGTISAEGPESEGCDYPDCSEEFLEATQLALTVCDERLKLRAPLKTVTKSGVLGLADKFGIEVSSTISCLTPGDDGRSCYHCSSCAEMIAATKTRLLL